ncbi:sugar phosphate isomerase/epimerase family protein [Ereboglobus luteus]|uniref:Xylose isomerase-like TIM barrel domain-containing protein n=1 Tax=Ereboglobus luteus TaxID=1796921 RepID=A0A2U8E5N0_9BACT|nr:sugar phosphate isomerase/epimerase [Ereboglobus luteus]AWI10151.1 hypothetical protein CKA38_13585 [Ereboglobus luteus]
MKKILILLCAMTLAAVHTNAAEKNIGLQMYSLRTEIAKDFSNIDTIIAAIAKAGYKYVETANYSGDGKIYGMEPAVFAEKLRAHGLHALSCHVQKRFKKTPTRAELDEALSWWDKCIADHKAAGMKYVIMPSMPRLTKVEDIQAFCEYLNKIGDKCNAAGLKFGYHNHAFEFETKLPNKLTKYEYMLQNTDPGKVFFEMDVYWTVMGRFSPVELFKQYPGRFLVLHIKDQKELGQSGMVGFEAIFKNIDGSGAKYLIVEVEKYNMPPIESVTASLKYLNDAPYVKADYSK